jgi:hypothetical protein
MVGLVIAVCAVIIAYVWSANRPSPNHGAAAVPGGPVLKKQWERFERDDNNVIVTGAVKNIGPDRIAYFQATTTFYDAKGHPVLSDPSVVDRVSLEPGETANYKTLAAPIPRIEIEVTNFTDVSGIPIQTEKAPQLPGASSKRVAIPER